ncbi:MAG TPA: hypothetical protein VNA17_10415 [Pyrinomonadaceae bacterium]|nr:hypothetical protein [Pyrinomonadaceae bacterium]
MRETSVSVYRLEGERLAHRSRASRLLLHYMRLVAASQASGTLALQSLALFGGVI